MHLLYADSHTTLQEQTRLFEEQMEPLLQRLDATNKQGGIPRELPEIPQYLQVCRWPFRKLEYSFALDALLSYLHPGQRYLDAGCGVTPLAHVLAGQGLQVDACDGDNRLIAELQAFDPQHVFHTPVTYSAQDITALAYPEATFDAISCISVLEHIPTPHDQQALLELLRVLKPNGLLVLTVDFTPTLLTNHGEVNWWAYHARRASTLTRQGNIREVGRAVVRKLKNRRASKQAGCLPRSANQCFQVSHLRHDILPLLASGEISSQMAFPMQLEEATAEQARRFWDLEPGLYNNQDRRDVLPAALLFRKAAA